MIRTRQALYPGYVMSFLIEFQRLKWKNLTICVIALHVFIYKYLCCAIYNVTFQNDDENITYKVEVSYIEIYNEKVRDLLCPRGYVTNNRFRFLILRAATWLCFPHFPVSHCLIQVDLCMKSTLLINHLLCFNLEIMLPWESVNTRF